MKILVTGGAGYIGTHTLIELYNHHHQAVVIDNLSNSKPEGLHRVEEIVGQKIPFYQGDVQDKALLRQIFDEQQIEAVIHFAGLKAVDKSIEDPLFYYRNNIVSTLSLCEVMKEKGVKKLIFSSSATVYGTPEELPLKETSRTGVGITNPYGQTKYMIEQILSDLAHSDEDWHITSLRYFNPIGAHPSGKIGEDPHGTPNNLTPYLLRVAVGRLDKLRIFGNDYDTPDGSGVRDYIHVVDLAKGHVAALEHLQPGGKMAVFNLGVGHGVSVHEIRKAFERAIGKPVPHEIVARRPGDLASVYADTTKAAAELKWHATKSIEEGAKDGWRWQSNNPHGYDQ